MRLAVIILTWKGLTRTVSCVASAISSGVSKHDVIVVDNASCDGTVEALRARYPAITVLQNSSNLGYAGGMNTGIRYALADGRDFVCVLNNDTAMTDGMVGLLIDAAADDKVDRAVSPRIFTMEEPPRLWFAGGVVEADGYPRHLKVDEVPSESRPYSSWWLSGCCILAHRRVWEKVGPFDESYFLLFEDAEWSRRARASGVDLMVAPRATLRHEVSASFKASAPDRLGAYYYARNGVKYVQTGRSSFQALRFSAQHSLRPHARALVRETTHRRRNAVTSTFALAGLLGGAVNQDGPAPRWLQALAQR